MNKTKSLQLYSSRSLEYRGGGKYFVYKMITSATEGKGIGTAGVGAALLLE